MFSMSGVNLLPWREERRKYKEKIIYLLLGISVGIAIAFLFVISLYIDVLITNQKYRNSFLDEKIKNLDTQITEINVIEKKKKLLIDRIHVIKQFQYNRSDSVKLLNEIVAVTPEGLHLTSYKQEGNHQTIIGVAQSNARVSALMRNIERSKTLDLPTLNFIKAEGETDSGGSVYSSFTMTAKQINRNGTEKSNE